MYEHKRTCVRTAIHNNPIRIPRNQQSEAFPPQTASGPCVTPFFVSRKTIRLRFFHTLTRVHLVEM
jgi:hypothetical protein